MIEKYATFRNQKIYNGYVSTSFRDKAFIFSIPQLATKLDAKSELFIDGTFKISPKLFKQVLIIYGQLNNQVWITS